LSSPAVVIARRRHRQCLLHIIRDFFGEPVLAYRHSRALKSISTRDCGSSPGCRDHNQWSSALGSDMRITWVVGGLVGWVVAGGLLGSRLGKLIKSADAHRPRFDMDTVSNDQPRALDTLATQAFERRARLVNGHAETSHQLADEHWPTDDRTRRANKSSGWPRTRRAERWR
jgi:hypothetical protein